MSVKLHVYIDLQSLTLMCTPIGTPLGEIVPDPQTRDMKPRSFSEKEKNISMFFTDAKWMTNDILSVIKGLRDSPTCRFNYARGCEFVKLLYSTKDNVTPCSRHIQTKFTQWKNHAKWICLVCSSIGKFWRQISVLIWAFLSFAFCKKTELFFGPSHFRLRLEMHVANGAKNSCPWFIWMWQLSTDAVSPKRKSHLFYLINNIPPDKLHGAEWI